MLSRAYPRWSHGKDIVPIVRSYHSSDVLLRGQRELDRPNMVSRGGGGDVELREGGRGTGGGRERINTSQYN